MADLDKILGNVAQEAEEVEQEVRGTVAQVVEETGAWYDDGIYWARENRGQYKKYNKGDFTLHLAKHGLPRNKDKHDPLSPAEEGLYMIQTARTLDYVGVLAGYKQGINITEDGQRVLVPYARPVLEPDKNADPTFFREYIERLLGDPKYPDQVDQFRMWVKNAWMSFMRDPGEWLQGCILALGGPPSCGKSALAQTLIDATGGKSGDPMKFFTGQTQFSGDLAKTYFLVADDAPGAHSAAARNNMTSMIKSWCYGATPAIHPKGKEQFSMQLNQRVIYTFNEGMDDAAVLPLVRDGFEDKILLFRCRNAIPEWFDQARDGSIVKMLLPSFAGYLYETLYEWECPKHLTDVRFGVKGWQHPELMKTVQADSPEMQLLDLIDLVLFNTDDSVEVGTITARGPGDEVTEYEIRAGDLYRALRGHADRSIQEQARGAGITSQTRLGQILGRASQTHPERVERVGLRSGYTIWKLKAPVGEY